MSQTLYAAKPGSAYDPAWWQAVYALYEEAFPGLSEGIAKAAAAGARWQDVSTPFVLMEDGRAIAHVGVISHPMRLAGHTVEVAGIHAVCTTNSRRRQGLAHRLIAEALAWTDERFAIAKLHTDLPAVYESHAFRRCQTWRFRSSAQASADVKARLLEPQKNHADAQLLAHMLRSRTPVSDRCASVDSGCVEIIVASLTGVINSGLWLLEEQDAIVAFAKPGRHTLVLDVIAETLPSLPDVLGAVPDRSQLGLWTFSPDLLANHAEVTAIPADSGSFMVRGSWPVSDPFGISPLWEH